MYAGVVNSFCGHIIPRPHQTAVIKLVPVIAYWAVNGQTGLGFYDPLIVLVVLWLPKVDLCKH